MDYRVRSSILQQYYEIEQNQQQLQRDSQAYASSNASRPSIWTRTEDLQRNSTSVIESGGFLQKDEPVEKKRDISKGGASKMPCCRNGKVFLISLLLGLLIAAIPLATIMTMLLNPIVKDTATLSTTSTTSTTVSTTTTSTTTTTASTTTTSTTSTTASTTTTSTTTTTASTTTTSITSATTVTTALLATYTPSTVTCSSTVATSCTTTTSIIAICQTYEVAWNGRCYYLDGSGTACAVGYSRATNDVLTCISTEFAGKNYRSIVSNNCCVSTADTYQCYGLGSQCNAAGPFTSGPTLGGAGCTDAQLNNTQQLTFCGSI